MDVMHCLPRYAEPDWNIAAPRNYAAPPKPAPPMPDKPLRIAHVALCTPHKCGLYETTRELVAAERALGIDARIYDPKPTPFYPVEDNDRGALLTLSIDWVRSADVVVDHSGCDGTTDGCDVPHILVPHGRPKHSFLGELQKGGTPVYSYQHRLERDPRYKAVVTFWPEHIGHLRTIFKSTTVHAIPAPVDLDAWSPEGPKHTFGGKLGKYNVVLTDSWRDDGDMFDAVSAVILAGRMLPGLKVHITGFHDQAKLARGWPVLLNTLRDDGTLGEVAPWATPEGLAAIYRGADLLVTPHHIQTRTVREAWACGLPICRVDKFVEQSAAAIVRCLQNPISRAVPRQVAEMDCDPAKAAEEFIAIAKGVLACR